jgi:glyoxylase-like metal-dependent hydrolase (beta-lactamase superfamily II)
MIKAANTILSIADDKTKIIPGHGPLADKAKLIAFRDMLKGVEKLSIAARAKKQPYDELALSTPVKKIEVKWGKGFLNTKTFLKIVYSGMDK